MLSLVYIFKQIYKYILFICILKRKNEYTTNVVLQN